MVSKLLFVACLLLSLSAVLAEQPKVCLGLLFAVTSDSALLANRCIATVQYLVDEASRNPALPNISWGLHTDNDLIDTHGFPFRTAALALKQAVTPCKNGALLSVMLGPVKDEPSIAAATVLNPLGVPMISPLSRTPVVGNMRLYPRSFRTSSNFAREPEALFRVMMHHDWHKVAVVYSQDNDGVMIANLLPEMARAANYEMDILEQAISPTDAGDGAYRIMKNFRDLRYRIILIHASEGTAKLLTATMEKLNMLNGDFIVLGTSYWTSSSTGETEVLFDNDEKLRLRGSIGISYRLPSGELWEQFLANITRFAPEYFYPTHDDKVSLPIKNAQDATSLVIKVVSELAADGLPINSDTIFQKLLAAKEFEGVSGRVFLDENYDAFPEIVLTNFIHGGFEPFGRYYVPPGKSIAEMAFDSPIHWPDGSVGDIPSDQVPRHLMTVPAWAINFSYVVLAIGILFNLALHHTIHKERAHEVIKASSPMFCHLIISGSAFTYLIAGLGSIGPDVLCRVLPGAVAAAFSIIFGSLFAKTWRIHRIFNSRTLTRKAPTNKNLLIVVAILLGLEALVQLVWMSYDLPRVEIRPHPTDQFASIQVCSANHMDAWWTMSLLFKVITILFGLYFAYKVRKLNHNFNEAKYISLAVYNLIFLSILLLPLALLFESNPTASYLVRTLGPMICAMITLALLFVPKFWDIYVTHDWVEYVSDAIYENGVLVHKSSKHSNGSHNGHNSNGSFNNTNSVNAEKPGNRPVQTVQTSGARPAGRPGAYMFAKEPARSYSGGRQAASVAHAAAREVSLSNKSSALSPSGTATPNSEIPLAVLTTMPNVPDTRPSMVKSPSVEEGSTNQQPGTLPLSTNN